MGGRVPPVLWQLQNSIYVEKARWALDFKGVVYGTRTLPPIVHRGVLVALRRGQTVPVLDLDDGRHVRDSTAIIATVEQLWPDPPLYPSDPDARREALDLEERFDDQIGHEARRLTLDATLDHPDVIARMFLRGLPRPLQSAARASSAATGLLTRRQYGVDDASVARAREQVDVALDTIEARTTAGSYLVGDAFSVADLTAAALLAPVAMPPEYHDPWWIDHPVPERLRALVAELAARPGIAWAREMYRRHRGARRV
jgi:glutathione S-transferase